MKAYRVVFHQEYIIRAIDISDAVEFAQQKLHEQVITGEIIPAEVDGRDWPHTEDANE